MAHVDGAYPAPDEIYHDPVQREAFQAWVLEKVAWAEGHGGPPKPRKALVSALRNYHHPRFGWFAFQARWSQPEGGPHASGSRAPGQASYPGHDAWPGGPGPGSSPELRASRQRHWQQVQAVLAQARAPHADPVPRQQPTSPHTTQAQVPPW